MQCEVTYFLVLARNEPKLYGMIPSHEQTCVERDFRANKKKQFDTNGSYVLRCWRQIAERVSSDLKQDERRYKLQCYKLKSVLHPLDFSSVSITFLSKTNLCLCGKNSDIFIQTMSATLNWFICIFILKLVVHLLTSLVTIKLNQTEAFL